ncbi:PP2C family protein-serine/threonine phosphatase, partial [Cellulosimicrobium funkei]
CDGVSSAPDSAVASLAAAQDAILATVGTMADRENPPSCTFVAAVVDGPLVVAGWVGDSRAYWIPDDGDAHQLSVDDSWAQEMIALGVLRVLAVFSPFAYVFM